MLYPLLDPARSSASAQALSEGYMLTGSFIDWAWESYAPPVLPNPSFAAIPSATIVTAGLDPLRDEGEALVPRLAADGVAVTLRRYPGMIHGFAGMAQYTPIADEALAFVGSQLRAALTP